MQHDDGGWGWWPSDANHPFMTGYAVWGLDEARRAGVKVDAYRIGSGARVLAQYLCRSIPARCRTSKPTWPTCCSARAANPTPCRGVAEGNRGRIPSRRRRATRCRAMRDRLSAYGRALLLLTARRAPRTAARTSSPRHSKGRRSPPGDLSCWASDTDTLLGDNVQHARGGHRARRAGAGRPQSAQPAAGARGALPAAQSHRRLLGHHRSRPRWPIYGLLAFMRARGETAQPFAVDVFVERRAGRPAARSPPRSSRRPTRTS